MIAHAHFWCLLEIGCSGGSQQRVDTEQPGLLLRTKPRKLLLVSSVAHARYYSPQVAAFNAALKVALGRMMAVTFFMSAM